MSSRVNQYAPLAVVLIAASFFGGCSATKDSKNAAASPSPDTGYKVDPATAGVVIGKALFSGRKPDRKKIDMDQDPPCAKLHPDPVYDDAIAVNEAGALANVFVYIKQGLEDKKFTPSTDQVVIDQKGCWFRPRVLGVQVGQILKVTNSDPLTHNIHPLAQVNREWNQSQPPESEPFIRRFIQPEIMIRVKCNIHGWMRAWIGAVPHPYFVVTGADGAFELKNVPPGNYVIEAWQEELGKQEHSITLAPSGKNEITFQFK